MMTKEQIAKCINPDFPGIYAPTTFPTKLLFEDGSFMVGFFHWTPSSDELEKQNKFTFIQFGENAQKFRETNDQNFLTVINGAFLISVEYPSSPK